MIRCEAEAIALKEQSPTGLLHQPPQGLRSLNTAANSPVPRLFLGYLALQKGHYRSSGMMLTLILHVLHHRIQLPATKGYDPILSLPTELMEQPQFMVDEVRAIAFDLPDEVR